MHMYRFSIGTTDVLTMKKENVHKVLSSYVLLAWQILSQGLVVLKDKYKYSGDHLFRGFYGSKQERGQVASHGEMLESINQLEFEQFFLFITVVSL